MFNTPILFLVFNRPDLTEKVFARIRDIKPAKLFLAADGPRENKPGESILCEQTRQTVLEHIDWDCEVHTLLRDANLGCKLAVSSAITWFFENVEEGIILEDDILPDASFFTYCEEMLIRYREDERVAQVSGVNLMDEWTKNESYLFSKAGGIWGWATWRRAWKHYDINIKSWGDKKVKNKIQNYLEKKDWFDRLKGSFDMVYKSEYDTWDFQWVYTQLKIQSLSIIPSKNLVENIGFRGDGTHTHSNSELLESKIQAHTIGLPLVHPKEIISDDEYLNYCLSLISKKESYYQTIIKKIKTKIKSKLIK